MTVAIKVEDLVKSYPQKSLSNAQNTVIKGISFEVRKGEIFALLGTNGAGKTTTLECIEGIRDYDSGKITLYGSVGVQLQSSSLPDNIKVIEAYTLFCKWNKAKIDLFILESLGLTEIKNKQYCQLSTGQKRRLHLALALIGIPDIIFLDEPTAGLDVEGRAELHKQIKKLKECGKTILLTSHDMAEVDSLCDRIAILKDGKIAFVGTTDELTSKTEEDCRIYIKTERPIENVVSKQGYSVFQSTNIGDTLLQLLQICKEKRNKVIDVKIERATLEESFIDIARGES